ncbi:MAG: type IV pilus assembly protein PilM [Candidatus Pacebacteria bacterium]|jgi:type IV pilus assembly protein PilM|nr:type IV pilus assembly protein PilM [Candidatus Paceibacterota bacterium]
MASFLDPITKLFGGGHKGAILGIDIGSSFIKVVLVEKVGEKVVLKNYGEIALGPRAGASAGQATNLPPEKIAETLHDLLKEAGITAQHTLLAIPFSASLLTVVELPEVGKKELDSMIPIEARRYIPVPISEVSLDWWILPKRKAGEKVPAAAASGEKVLGKIEVIIAAIHNEVISKYESIKRNAQIPGEGSHFEIEIFSTLRAVVGRDLSPVLVADIGAGSTKLALVDEGVVRGSHVISMGSQDISIALSRSQAISFEKAEELKCRVGVTGDAEGRDVFVVAELLLSNIMNEAKRFVENYENKYNTKITKVILVGGGARLKGIEKIVEKNFPNTSIVIGDPFARLDTPAFLAPTLKELSPDFAVAVGLALKGLEE